MQSFPKESRLRARYQYDRVFKNAKKVDKGSFFALYAPNTEGRARLGLCISKKSCPRACDRNRVKRLIRESFRTTDVAPVDVILLSRNGVLRLTNQELTEKLTDVWHKLERTKQD